MVPPSVLLVNIGRIATGDGAQLIADGDTIRVVDGRIAAIGRSGDVDDEADVVVDANGLSVIPGLIDPHVHPMVGDWNPRQAVMGWMEAAFHGGVTSMVSQGVVHLPDLPSDPATSKSLAIASTRIWERHRPGGGLKVLSGSIVLQSGLTRDDFQDLAAAGVRLVAEIGGAGLHDMDEILPMIGWAREFDMTVPLHFGPPSYPGSVHLGTDEALAYDVDVMVHMNGGSTAAHRKERERALTETGAYAEIIHCGNMRAAVEIVGDLLDRNETDRLIIGSDSPVGHGAIPLAIIKTMSQICSMTTLAPEQVVAAATGNSARAYRFDDVGILEPGRKADLLIVDRPTGSAARDGLETFKVGDVPAVTLIMVDGEIVALRARNTTFTDRQPTVRTAAGVTLAPRRPGVLPPLWE